MQIAFEMRRGAHALTRAALLPLAGLFLGGVFMSCSSAPKPELTRQERLQQDNSFGTAMAPVLEARVKSLNEPSVTRYLEELASQLVRTEPTLRDMSVRVAIIKEPSGRWTNYGLPGVRLYLSGELLSALNFETELAAAIALELGQIARRGAVRRYEALVRDADPLGDAGIFSFSDEERLAALETAMNLLYEAGFDPRGMVGLLNRYRDTPGRSPLPERTAEKLLVSARRTIALHAPLRNPIVRSERFVGMQKRMQKL